jgi:hypothetical protein
MDISSSLFYFCLVLIALRKNVVCLLILTFNICYLGNLWFKLWSQLVVLTSLIEVVASSGSPESSNGSYVLTRQS